MALTDAQKTHNFLVEMEARQADREFELREEIGRQKNAWFNANFPDASEAAKATYGINMVARKRICAIIYVE
jgi:hypothetical protein